jgi:hypothetical protein
MDVAEFKKVWNAHDGWNKCQLIIFDNSGRWIFNRRRWHKHIDKTTDAFGNTFEKHTNNDPRGFCKVDENGELVLDKNGQPIPDYLPISEYLTFREDLGTLELKRWFVGTTEEDKQNGSPMYSIEVRHVENIQMMCFCDDANEEARPLYPPSMT